MCEICESMLAAEHKQRSGAELCPKCKRFPLDAEVQFDPTQWDYVAQGGGKPGQSFQAQPPLVTGPDADALQPSPIDAGEFQFEETDYLEEEQNQVRTCYHCYQIASGLAERCPVCGDSYLPAALRQPHLA